MNEAIKIPKFVLDILDQVFEIERKAQDISEKNSIARNINRLKEIMENFDGQNGVGLVYHNPMGERYSVTRSDLEATIAGNAGEHLIVTEVIKPIIRIKTGAMTHIVRKGVVVVTSVEEGE